MSAAAPPDPRVKGWCPSLLRPMASGDGLVARIKPSAATLTADQLQAVAEAAARHGSGEMEVTSRGNLQARGFDEAGHRAFAEVVLAHGLASPDPAAEAQRTVLAAPLSPADDPTCAFDAHGLARALERAKTADPALAHLPEKVGLAVCGGGALPIAPGGQVVGADITVSPAGSGRAMIALAAGRAAATVDPGDVVPAVVALLHAFLDLGGRAMRRMAGLVAGVGEEPVFAAAGLEANSTPIPSDLSCRVVPGVVDLAGGWAAVLVAPAFGRAQSAAFADLAELARRHGDGTVRLTPWRTLVLPGVKANGAAGVQAEARRLGFLTDPADPRRRIAVCAGAPRCVHAHADVVADAERFAPLLPEDVVLHVSGCSKGCAHPRPAALTLTAGPGGYGWITNGRADDAPAAEGLSAQDVSTLLKRMSA
ncbi:MAG: precorrin-3B synthase [Rhodospirillaceae bacterium]|nr:precorrin-3B synthase [Rhodospirillaceae bacterium]